MINKPVINNHDWKVQDISKDAPKVIYLVLLLLIFNISCSGQSKNHLLKDGAREPKVIPFRQQIANTLWPDTMPYGQIFRCGLRDKAGNLWFGTTGAGVYRYDGKSFTNFSEKDGLCNNTVTCILEDKAGNLWFGSDVKDGSRGGGLCRYDGKSFTSFMGKMRG